MHTEAPVAPVKIEKPESEVSYIQAAQPGDSVWKMTKHQLQSHLGEKFTGLIPEQQTYIIDAIKDRIGKAPNSFGLVDINKIKVGQKIDFGTILHDQDFMNKTISHAQNLSPEQIANIHSYNKNK